MSSSSSDDDDDDDDEVMERYTSTYTSTTAVGEPYMRFQGAYLSNLLKLLNEASTMGMCDVMRWHPKISNALQINWKALHRDFDKVHPVLVRYKISRSSNRPACVRPTMNRKLREWSFSMVADGTHWVSYVYKSDLFCRQGLQLELPATRRRRGI